MSIIEAKAIHIQGIVMLVRAELEEDPAPNQTISQEKVYDLVKICVMNKINYTWVSVKDGVVVASLCALITDQPIYQRKMAAIMQFYTTEPGEDEKLLDHFLEWTRGQRKIKRIVAILEQSTQVGDLLFNKGLTDSMPTYSEWR